MVLLTDDVLRDFGFLLVSRVVVSLTLFALSPHHLFYVVTVLDDRRLGRVLLPPGVGRGLRVSGVLDIGRRPGPRTSGSSSRTGPGRTRKGYNPTVEGRTLRGPLGELGTTTDKGPRGAWSQ